MRESNYAHPQPRLSASELRTLAQDGFAHVILPVMGMPGQWQVEHPDFRMIIPNGSVRLYQALGYVVAEVRDLLDLERDFYLNCTSVPTMKREINGI